MFFFNLFISFLFVCFGDLYPHLKGQHVQLGRRRPSYSSSLTLLFAQEIFQGMGMEDVWESDRMIGHCFWFHVWLSTCFCCGTTFLYVRLMVFSCLSVSTEGYLCSNAWEVIHSDGVFVQCIVIGPSKRFFRRSLP